MLARANVALIGEHLVGRAETCGVLDAGLTELDSGRSAALALVGEPGIGKTRLLAELAARADARGQLVLYGSASELERDLPFWVFVDALDEYVQGLEPRRLEAFEDDVRTELAHVLPSLSRFAADRAAVFQHERYRSHRAVRELLERLTATGPLVLVLDDLHCADSARRGSDRFWLSFGSPACEDRTWRQGGSREGARLPPAAAADRRPFGRQAGVLRRAVPGDLRRARRSGAAARGRAARRARHRPRGALRGHGPQRPPVPRAVPRRVPRRRGDQPAQPAARTQGARVHPRRLGHEGLLLGRLVRAAHRRRARGGRHRAGGADRRGRRAPRRPLRGAARRGGAGRARGARGGRPGRAHVHGRHHRAAEGRAARPAGRDAEHVPRRDAVAPRGARGVPAPDADVPRRVDGRDPREYPPRAAPRRSCRCSSPGPCSTRSSRTA